MIAHLIRSLLQGILVILAVGLIAFSMFRFVGDPIASLAGQEATDADRIELAERLGLKRTTLQNKIRRLGIAKAHYQN